MQDEQPTDPTSLPASKTHLLCGIADQNFFLWPRQWQLYFSDCLNKQANDPKIPAHFDALQYPPLSRHVFPKCAAMPFKHLTPTAKMRANRERTSIPVRNRQNRVPPHFVVNKAQSTQSGAQSFKVWKHFSQIDQNIPNYGSNMSQLSRILSNFGQFWTA